MYTQLQNCNSLNEIVNLINNEFSTDLSPEQLAAEYALDADKEAKNMALKGGYEYTTNSGSIEVHLDVLIEEGAKFDYAKALEIALDI